MQLRKWILLAVLLMLTAVSIKAQADTSAVRFVHVIPGLTAIDVYVNENVAVEGLEYGQATTYMSAPAGAVNVRVTLAGLTTTLWQQSSSLPANDAVTLIASSINPLSFEPYRDDLTPLGLGTSRFQAIHAMDGGPSLEFIAEGQTIITDLAYKGVVGPSDVPTNNYVMSAVPSGSPDAEPIIPDTSVGLAGATANMLVLYGSGVSPQTLVLSAATQPEGEAGLVRFAHGVADAPSVDVLVDGQLVVPGLAYGEASEHIPVAAGSHTATIQVAGGGAEVASAEFEVADGSAATAVALGSAEAAELSVFEDAIAGSDARTALFSVINTVPDSTATVTLGDETALATELASGETADVVSQTAIKGALTVELAVGDDVQTVTLDPQTFYGGVYYNVLVGTDSDGAPTLFVAPTGLAQAVNSAPGSSDAVTDVPVVEASPTLEPAVEATTETSADVPTPTTESVAVAVTEVPATFTATPVPPSPVPTTEFPTGRPIIDADARLNMRTYPSTNSESRGQIPGTANAVLDIIGRQSDIEIGDNGLPVDLVIPEDSTTLVDPFAELDPELDIPAAETWLYIAVDNPEGGEVRAWVRADFVDIRSQRGERQRLRDLPLVASNTPGDGTYGARPVAQIETPEAIVFSLAPDVALIIRERLLPVVGEPLQRIFNNTRMELVGITTLPDDTEWAFVRYRPDPNSNTVVSGWASTQYLRYEFRGEPVTLEQLNERNLLQDVSAEDLGSVTGNAPAVVLPTTDPLKDRVVATVNVGGDTALQFRPGPDTIFAPTAELTNGTRVPVISRNGAFTWIQVEFEGQTGWVSASFVTLSLNGRPFNLADLPVNEEFSATAEPTITPGGPTFTPVPSETPTEETSAG